MNRIWLLIVTLFVLLGVWVVRELPRQCIPAAVPIKAGTSVGDAGGSAQTCQPILRIPESQPMADTE